MITNEYIAGFIDGEGCIYMHRLKHNGKYTFSINVRILNENKSVLEQIKDIYGGALREANNPHKNGRRYWDLCLSGKRALHIIAGIEPFLIVKKAQAEVVLMNAESVRPRRGGNYREIRITGDIQMARENVWKTLKQLKGRWDNRESVSYS